MACLIDESVFHKELSTELSKADKSITILSAFSTLPGVRWLKENLPSEDIEVTIISRWQPNDLISGSSSYEVYSYCKDNNWNFRIDTKLHSKVYCIDESVLFIGSANLTSKGLSLGKQGNYELSAKAYADQDDRRRIDEYISSCFEMNDDVYDAMLRLINENKNSSLTNTLAEWPESIVSKINPKVEYLWVEDLLFLSPSQILSKINNTQSDLLNHDLEVLGITRDNLSEDVLRECFVRSKLYNWLIGQFEGQKATSLQFGKVTALLHNSLLEDPKPYRKVVKEFVALIFEWVGSLNLENIHIEKYRHSQSINYNKEAKQNDKG